MQYVINSSKYGWCIVISSKYWWYIVVSSTCWWCIVLSSGCYFKQWTLIIHWRHYTYVIMSGMASQITSLTTVYSTVYSDANQRKHQSSASLAFVRGIHRGPVNSPHKRPVTRKMFPFDDVIMVSSKCWYAVEYARGPLTQAYDATIQIFRKLYAKIKVKMYILWWIGSEFCVTFQRCSLKFRTKFWPLTPQTMHFTRC